MIASNVAKSSGTVVFLDTGNSFSPKRVAEVVNQMSDFSTSKVKNVTSRLTVVLIFLSIYFAYSGSNTQEWVTRCAHLLSFLSYAEHMMLTYNDHLLLSQMSLCIFIYT